MAEVGSVDVELAVMVALRAYLGSGVVVRDELDNDLINELPTVQVQVAGGDDDIDHRRRVIRRDAILRRHA